MQAKQNWVLNWRQDLIWIIAAPAWSFLLVLLAYRQFGFAAVAGVVGIYSIAHHLPTFIRIYGDRDLMQRFRWSILLAPLIPFVSVMAIVGYIVANDLDVSRVTYVLVFVIVWAPWHLMMQHYGFMRIYDRNNQAPRHIQTRMDWTLCVAWFLFVLTATLHWLPELLYSLHMAGVGLMWLLNPSVIDTLVLLSWIAAAAMSVTYIGYVGWCVKRGYYVSYAKQALNLLTFGMLFITCIPNPLIRWLSPEWNFALGLLTLSVAHNSQYFAIVWRFNRRLADQPERRREGWFSWMFARGGLVVVVIYVVVSIAYGSVLGDVGRGWSARLEQAGIDTRWILGTILALAFTSELMHYYYDGFVWKVRHKETRELLENKTDSQGSEKTRASASWWSGGDSISVGGALGRHMLYFGLVIATLSYCYWRYSSSKQAPVRLGLDAIVSSSNELRRQALIAIDDQITVEQRMNALRERACHHSYLADLWLIRARLEQAAFGATDNYRSDVQNSIAAIERATALPPPLKHPESVVTSPFIRQAIDGKAAVGQLSKDEYLRWSAQLRQELQQRQSR